MHSLMRVLRSLVKGESRPLLGRWCRPDTHDTCNPSTKGEQADYDNGMHTMRQRQSTNTGDTRDPVSVHVKSFKM